MYLNGLAFIGLHLGWVVFKVFGKTLNSNLIAGDRGEQTKSALHDSHLS